MELLLLAGRRNGRGNNQHNQHSIDASAISTEELVAFACVLTLSLLLFGKACDPGGVLSQDMRGTVQVYVCACAFINHHCTSNRHTCKHLVRRVLQPHWRVLSQALYVQCRNSGAGGTTK